MNTLLFSILGNLLIFSGTLLLIGSTLTWLRAHRKYSTWEPAKGKVVEVVSHSISPSNFHYYPVIEFQTKIGETIRFESELGFYPAKHRQGQDVSIWYDGHNPKNVILDFNAAKWTVSLTLGIFGAIILIIGVIILSLLP